MLNMAVSARLASEVSKDSNALRSPFEYPPMGQDEEPEPSPRAEKNRNQRNTKGIFGSDSLTLPSQSSLSAKFHERPNDWRYGHRKHDCSTWYGPRCLESKIFRLSALVLWVEVCSPGQPPKN
jgi:hypothetical protein